MSPPPQQHQPPKISTYISANPTPLILDGALATYLEHLGADLSSSLWSASTLLTQPSLIQRTHLDYFRAGAHVAITASYQASIPGLVKHLGLSEEAAKDVVRTSVKLAKMARDEYVAERTGNGNGDDDNDDDEKLWIAGSVGPYGAYLADGSEYRGDYSISHSSLKDFHRGRIQALVSSGVDILACETLPSKTETLALLDLLTSEFPQTEAWFTFTLRDSSHIADGTPLTQIASLFTHTPQVVGLGFNCVPDDLALAALKNLKPLTDKVLVVYPNSGESWNAGKREWEGARTEGGMLEAKVVEWWGAGAGMIGGCCRTMPEDIRVMGDGLRRCRK
ncbi:Homocysteine S-methyltransferase [Ophiobolus disseminans]|uniref:Homocysteine S-methyltransferase n=1 Tax=Ophiobolus disseminans TaxID=1469910 RepID=A0A6A7A373_9PLEO|nr:Homocysteine S-methyltransferase [Ophiobolus disseminans]